MNGTFPFDNQPMAETAAVLGGMFSFCVMTRSLLLGMLFLLMTAAAAYFLSHITGSYETDSESVTFKILWRTYRIDFSEICSVRTEARRGERMRPDGTFRLEVTLTLCTYREDIVFGARHVISADDLLKDPGEYRRQLDQLALTELGRYIQKQIG